MKRYGYAPEHARALELLKTEWVPPAKIPAFPSSRQRLALSLVIDLLAFGAPNPPADMPPLLCTAHRQRAFKAIQFAARESRVRLFGTPRGSSTRQEINAIQFDHELVLTEEENSIGFDPNAAKGERFTELLQDPNHYLWRDVHVDRQSLIEWLRKLPAQRRRQAKARGKSACEAWLIKQRESGPQQKIIEEYRAEATSRFGVGPDQFRTAWQAAKAKVPREDWGVPGRPKIIRK
jgi:hypothetical protein